MGISLQQTTLSVYPLNHFSPLTEIIPVERYLRVSLASTLNWIDSTQERHDPCAVDNMKIRPQRSEEGNQVFSEEQYRMARKGYGYFIEERG